MGNVTIEQPAQAKLITQDVSAVFREYGLSMDEEIFQTEIEYELERYSLYGYKNIFVKNILPVFEYGHGIKIRIDDFEKFSKQIQMKQENATARKKLLQVGNIHYHRTINGFIYKSNLHKGKIVFRGDHFEKNISFYNKALTPGEINEYQLKRQFNAEEAEDFLRDKMETLVSEANESADVATGLKKMTEKISNTLVKRLVWH